MEAAAESHNTVLPEPARNPRRAGRNKTRDTPELNMPKEQTGTTTRRVKIIVKNGADISAPFLQFPTCALTYNKR